MPPTQVIFKHLAAGSIDEPGLELFGNSASFRRHNIKL